MLNNCKCGIFDWILLKPIQNKEPTLLQPGHYSLILILNISEFVAGISFVSRYLIAEYVLRLSHSTIICRNENYDRNQGISICSDSRSLCKGANTQIYVKICFSTKHTGIFELRTLIYSIRCYI